MEGKCVKCGMATEGYKCNVDGAESATHDANHGKDDPTGHPKGDWHCMPKCSGCQQAEVNCTCG